MLREKMAQILLTRRVYYPSDANSSETNNRNIYFGLPTISYTIVVEGYLSPYLSPAEWPCNEEENS